MIMAITFLQKTLPLLLLSTFLESTVTATVVSDWHNRLNPGVSPVHYGVGLRPTNDTVCRFLGYRPTNNSQLIFINNSRVVLMNNQTGLVSGGTVPSVNAASSYFVNVSSYFNNTLALKNGLLFFDTPSLYTLSPHEGGIKVSQSSTGQIQSFSAYATSSWQVDHGAPLYNSSGLNETLLSNGTLILPNTLPKLMETASHLTHMATSYIKSTGLADDNHGTEQGNNTIMALLTLAGRLKGIARNINGTESLAPNGTIDYFESVSNCLQTGNHTRFSSQAPSSDHNGPVRASEKQLKRLNEFGPGEVGVRHINRCDQAYYFATASIRGSAVNSTRVGPNELYHEAYHPSTGGGISVKIANEHYDYLTGDVGIAQFEYNLNQNGDRMYMDLSFIDCGPHRGPALPQWKHRDLQPCPLRDGGWLARWVAPDELNCGYSYCPGVEDPNEPCEDAYMEDDHDFAVRSCVWGENPRNRVDFELISCPNAEDLAIVG